MPGTDHTFTDCTLCQSDVHASVVGVGAVQPAELAAAVPAIAVQGLHVRLGQAHILHGVDVAIAAGRWTAIVGPNGAGKSTLLRALAGLLPHSAPTVYTAHAASEVGQVGRQVAVAADVATQQRLARQSQTHQGQVHWWGKALSSLKPRQRAHRMAWLGQNEEAAPDLRVWDVVMLGRLPHQGWLALPSEADKQAVTQALHTMRAWDWRDRPLGQLSGGERQRVLLARALATEADLLLMDEPLMHLDPPHQADWIATVQALVAQGKTVVSVLHELNVALMSDAMLILQSGGRVLHSGVTADAATHRALEAVFNHRISVEAMPPRPADADKQVRWVAMPV